MELFFLELQDKIKYWHSLGKWRNGVDSLDSFHSQIVFAFKSIFPNTNLTIEIKGVICLISAFSIQVVDDEIRFNSIATLTLGSIELILYESEGSNLFRNKNILDNL